MAAGSYQLIWVAQGGGSGSVTLASLPQTGAATGQAIVWNGSSWAPGTVSGAGGGTLNSLSGDVTTGTVDGNGNAPATVAYVGGKAASTVAAITSTVQSAASGNGANTLVQRDSSGNFTAGTITAVLNGTATTATSYTGAVALSQLSQSSATTNQVIAWNGSGWAPATVSAGGTSGITQLNGDVTTPANSSGNTAATVAQVGGKTASAIATAVNTVASATSANTASTLVSRDSSGNFSAGTITAALSGNATTATTANSATNYTGSVTLSQLAQTSATSGQVIAWSGTAWAPATVSSGSSGITALTGDVTASGTGSVAATVAQVGGKTASAVASAVSSVAAATNANTASTIVARDSSGNFSAGTITAALAGNATTATTASSATSYTGSVALSQLAQTSATSGQAIVWSGTAWAPATVSGGGSGITQLTGDVTTASGSGSQAATVAAVGGQTASYVGAGAALANNATYNNTVGVLAARDGYGAIQMSTGVTALSNSTITATAAQSGTTFFANSSSCTVTLIANPANIGYKYRFVGNGGTIAINPPTTGTTPTFYYFGGSTTSAINQVNVNTCDCIEFTGIPGSSNYMVNNIQGNWQSAGSAIGVYSALSYPSTSGYLLTATGTTGAAAFAAPTYCYPGLSIQGFNGSITPSGAVISLMSGGQAFFTAKGACTIYSMSGSCTNSAQNVSFQPYGSANGSTGAGLIGTAKTVASTASGNNAATFTQAQNIAVSAGGYVGVGVTPTSTATMIINVILWVTQTGA